MAIDPMIANPSGLKLNDPLEQYNNYLVAATRQSGMRKARREEERMNALNDAMRYWDSSKSRQENVNALVNRLAAGGLGTEIFGTLENDAKLGKYEAETSKETALAGKANNEAAHELVKTDHTKAQIGHTNAQTDTEKGKAFEQAWNNSKQFLAGINTANPAEAVKQYGEWLKGLFRNPIILEGLTSRGMTPEQMIADMQTHAKSGTMNDLILRMGTNLDTASKVNYRTEDTGGWSLTRAEKANTLGAPESKVIDKQKVTESPKAPRVSVSVGAPSVSVIAAKGDTSYTEAWNKELAQDDIGLKRAADKAPELARRADRMDAALRSGKVITGVGAPFFLNVAKVLNTVGASDSETIANTEVLFSDMAKNTLDSIQASGLGSGNGFSNNDLKFLERAVGGDPNMSNEGMRKLVALSRRAAQLSAQKWAERKAEIGGTGIQGRAYPGTTPKVPPTPGSMKGTNGKTISAASIAELKRNPTPQERAEFDAYFGAGSAARVLGGKQ